MKYKNEKRKDGIYTDRGGGTKPIIMFHYFPVFISI